MDKYVDYTWYEQNYLLGRDSIIPPDLFDYYATVASAEVKNVVTLGTDMTNPIDEVKAATCEVAEILCQMDGKSEQDDGSVSVPVGVSSEKVGEYSVSYSGNSATDKATEKRYKVHSAMAKWLGVTGLLYRGQ